MIDTTENHVSCFFRPFFVGINLHVFQLWLCAWPLNVRFLLMCMFKCVDYDIDLQFKSMECAMMIVVEIRLIAVH